LLAAIGGYNAYQTLPSQVSAAAATPNRSENHGPETTETPPSSGAPTGIRGFGGGALSVAPLSQSVITSLQNADNDGQGHAQGADNDQAVSAQKSVAEASEAPGHAEGGDTDKAAQQDQDAAQVQKLQARDQEVRAHEQAHASAGGQYAGAPNYGYDTGPDGRQYAVSGEVSIDASPVPGNPQATIAKMDVVIKAALAPAEPSGQDRSVAAAATKQLQAAQAELLAQKQEERFGDSDGATSQVSGRTEGGSENQGPEIPTIGGAAPTPSATNSTISGGASAAPIVNLFA
jgi:SprA-related family